VPGQSVILILRHGMIDLRWYENYIRDVRPHTDANNVGHLRYANGSSAERCLSRLILANIKRYRDISYADALLFAPCIGVATPSAKTKVH